MKLVIWEDRRGWLHRSLVRDEDSDDMGPQGIAQDPPDIDEIDWDAVKKEIHNRLVEAGLVTWMDVQRGQNQIRGIIRAALQRRIIQLYRAKDKEVET
jgi:hypothetical protein